MVPAMTLFHWIQLGFSLSNGLSVLLTMRGKVLGFAVLLPAHTAVAIYFALTGQYFLIIGNTIMFTAGLYGIYRFKKHGVHRDADSETSELRVGDAIWEALTQHDWIEGAQALELDETSVTGCGSPFTRGGDILVLRASSPYTVTEATLNGTPLTSIGAVWSAVTVRSAIAA